jgi:protein-L-isoaspartate(D-aspartate) O-methyltransferase
MSSIDYAKARETMVEQQVRPWDVLEPRVLGVLATLPREAFVAETHRALAYADLSLPLGHGELMLKPVLEGRILQALDLAPTDEVLEVGTGSGFLTACLGRLAREVVSLEIHPDLAEAARARLAAQGLDGNVRIEVGDALRHQTERRFDAVCITGAVATVPTQFLQWLRPGGRLFVVQGRAPAMTATVLRNATDGVHAESQFETELPYLLGASPAPAFKL